MKRKKKLPKYQLGNGSIDIKSPTTLWGRNQNANIDMLPPQNREGVFMINQQNTPITEDLQQQTQMDKSYSFGFNPIAYAGLTGINQFLSGLGSRKEESKYKQSLIDNGNSAIPFANNFSSGVKYGYQKGGRAPKIYTDRKQFEQAQRMYNDSLNLYNDGLKSIKELNDNKIAWNIRPLDKYLYDGLKKINPGALPIAEVQYNTGRSLNSGERESDGSNNYTKSSRFLYKQPVQPVVYQPQETITSPQTVSSQHGKKGMWGAEYDKKHPPIYVTNPKDPRIGQYGKDGNQYLYKGPTHPIQKMSRINPQQMDLNSNVNIQGQQIPFPQFQLPQQKGTPVYGPGNTIIGYSDNMNFKPAYEYTGASNNQLNLQDKALLADPEALKKYVLSRDNYKFPTEEFQQGGFSDPGHEDIINNGFATSIPTNRYEVTSQNDPKYRKLQKYLESGLPVSYNNFNTIDVTNRNNFIGQNRNRYIDELRDKVATLPEPPNTIGSFSETSFEDDILKKYGFDSFAPFKNIPINKLKDMMDAARTVGNSNELDQYLDYENSPLTHDFYKNDQLAWKNSDVVYEGLTTPLMNLPIPMLRQPNKPKLGMNSMSTKPLSLNNEQGNITGISTSMKPENASLDFRERISSQMNTISTVPSILESYKARMKGLPTNMTAGRATLNLSDETPSTVRQSMESMSTGNYPFSKDNNISFNPQAKSYPIIKNSMSAINTNNYRPSSQQANITGTPVIPNNNPVNINLTEADSPILRGNKTMESINTSPYPFLKSTAPQITGNVQDYPKQRMGMTSMSSVPYNSNSPANITGVATNMQIPTVQQPSYTTHPIEVYDKRGKFLRKEFIGNDKGIVDHKYIGRHHYAPRGGNSYIDTSYQEGGSFQDYLRQQNKPVTENINTLNRQPEIDLVKKKQALAKQAALYDRSFSKTPLETPASKARSIQLKNNYVANNPYSKLNDKGEIEAVSPERDLQGTPYNYTQAWRNDDGFQNMMHGLDAAMIATGVGELGVTVAKNAYKLNPLAIKNWYDVFHKGTLKNMLPGENAVNITRGLESENAIKDLFNTGIVRNNKSAGNVLTKRSSNYGERVFWADSESPLVGNNNFQITAKNSKELKNRPVTKDDIISIKRKTDNGYEDYPNWQNSFNTTPKPHWLKGYKEVPQPKSKVIDFIGKEEVAPHTNGAYGYPTQVSGAGMDVYPNTPNKFLNQEYSSFGNMEKGVVNIYQKGGAFDYGFLLEDDEDENQYNKNEAENNDRVTEEDVQEEVAKQSRKLADMEFLFGSNKVRKDRDVNRFDDDYVAPDSSSDGTDWASKFKSVEDPNSKFDHGNGAYGSFGFRKTGHLAEAYKSPEFQEVREQFGDYNSFWNSFKQSGYGPLSKTVDSRYEDWLKRQTGNNISIAGKFNLTGSKSPSSNWMVGNNIPWQGYVNKLNKYKTGGTYSVDNEEIANLIQKGVKFKFV